MAQAVLWVPVAPLQAGHSTGFSLMFRQGLDISLLFTSPLGGTKAVVLSRSQLCSMQTRRPSQAAVRCCCAMRDLRLRGHFGKAEALLCSSHGSTTSQRLHRTHISAAPPKAPPGGTHLSLAQLCSAAWGNRCFQEKGVQGQVSEGNARWPREISHSCRALSRQGTGGAFLSLLSQGSLMKNEPHAPVLATNAFPCGFLCAAVAFCRHLDSITLLIQPIKLETEH